MLPLLLFVIYLRANLEVFNQPWNFSEANTSKWLKNGGMRREQCELSIGPMDWRDTLEGNHFGLGSFDCFADSAIQLRPSPHCIKSDGKFVVITVQPLVRSESDNICVVIRRAEARILAVDWEGNVVSSSQLGCSVTWAGYVMSYHNYPLKKKKSNHSNKQMKM